MKSVLVTLLGLLIGLLLATIVSAQTPIKNPGFVQFTPMDYALVTSFEGGYFQIITRTDGTCDATTIPSQPIQIENLGKPSLRTDGDVQGVLTSRPAFGCFVYKVLARAGVFLSPWSEPSEGFQLVPLQQGRPVIR